jgi:hypothetical protein
MKKTTPAAHSGSLSKVYIPAIPDLLEVHWRSAWRGGQHALGRRGPKEHKTARKTGRPRIIPLVPTVIRLLLWVRRHSPDARGQDHVFVNGCGNSFSRGWLSLKINGCGVGGGCPGT